MTTASQAGLMVCRACLQLNRPLPGVAEVACARCDGALHWRQPGSIPRGWGYLIAAAVLYIPANLYPVMESGSLFGNQSDTILSGTVYLWTTGSWLLATIVFIASIVVPGAKLSSLAYLFWTAQHRSTLRAEQRSRLYRATEFIGRWSMVDIFVGGVLVALVQLKPFASVEPGPGAIYFGAVVILTMLASQSFDSRLIWDPADAHE